MDMVAGSRETPWPKRACSMKSAWIRQFAAPPVVDAPTIESDFPSKMAEKKSTVVPEAVSMVNVPFKNPVLSDLKGIVTEVFEYILPVVVMEATSPAHVVPLKDGGSAAKELQIDVENTINTHATKTCQDLLI